jgi:hypothetical protein
MRRGRSTGRTGWALAGTMVGIAESLRVDAEHRGQGGGVRVRLDSGGDEQARRYGVEGSSQLGFQDQPTQARRVSQKCGGIGPNDPVYVARACCR